MNQFQKIAIFVWRAICGTCRTLDVISKIGFWFVKAALLLWAVALVWVFAYVFFKSIFLTLIN